MTLSVLIIPLSFLFVSCGVNKQKNVATYEPDLPYEPAKPFRKGNHPGKSAYMKTCYQCHAQDDPLSLSDKKWSMTVPRMAEHAGISVREGEQILDYILGVRAEGLR